MKNLKNVNEHTCSLSLPPPNFWDCTRRGVEQSDRLVMLSSNRDTEMQEPAEGAHQMKKLKRTKHSCQSQMVCIYPSEPSCKTDERKMPLRWMQNTQWTPIPTTIIKRWVDDGAPPTLRILQGGWEGQKFLRGCDDLFFESKMAHGRTVTSASRSWTLRHENDHHRNKSKVKYI